MELLLADTKHFSVLLMRDICYVETRVLLDEELDPFEGISVRFADTCIVRITARLSGSFSGDSSTEICASTRPIPQKFSIEGLRSIPDGLSDINSDLADLPEFVCGRTYNNVADEEGGIKIAAV